MKLLWCTLIAISCTDALPNHGRIIGGQDAAPGQFPSIVGLTYINQFCDGSIINDQWVVTAAHCLTFAINGTLIVAGSHLNPASSGTQYTVKTIIQHEAFNGSTEQNDIALLQINGTFEFSDTVKPIEFIDPEANSSCFALGWGTTIQQPHPDVLQYIEVRALSFEDCWDMSQDAIGDLYFGREQVCAFGGEGKGACYGDSGGPLICDGKLAGIVSYGVAPCAKGKPDVYTRPTAYADWISTQIKQYT